MNELYRKYWNRPEVETSKPYAVSDVGDPRLKIWLRQTSNLEKGFLDGCSYLVDTLCWKGGRVLDVACGVCWTSALLTLRPEVQAVVAVDFSRHRVEDFAPTVIRQFGGHEDRITRIVGDAFEVKYATKFDLIVFTQALYMFPDPFLAMREAARLLNPGGMVMVACERIEPTYRPFSYHWGVRLLKDLLRGNTDDGGRTRMIDRDYRQAIEGAGFSYREQFLSYPVFPAAKRLPGKNFFGVKA